MDGRKTKLLHPRLKSQNKDQSMMLTQKHVAYWQQVWHEFRLWNEKDPSSYFPSRQVSEPLYDLLIFIVKKILPAPTF